MILAAYCSIYPPEASGIEELLPVVLAIFLAFPLRLLLAARLALGRTAAGGGGI